MLRDYILQYCREDAESTIKAADDAVNKIFAFNQKWDLERSETPIVFADKIDFLHQPGGDPEWVYAFNRLRHFVYLGQAYYLTADEKYASAFAEQCVSWIESVRPDDENARNAWRTIEAGIRLDTFVKSYRLLKDSPSFLTIKDKFMCSVEEHAAFILANSWNSYHLMSNWGILSNHGLYTAGCVFSRTDWQQEALRRLSLELQNEVYDDGMQWEQSPMYHNEVLREYLDVILFSDMYGYELEPWFRKRVHKMARVALCWMKPDGSEPMMGDSDDIDEREILAYGALVFSDGYLKALSGDNLDYQSAFLAGEDGIKRYGSIKPELPEELDFFLPESGNGFARTGWGKGDSYLRFHCGTLGAGHGHADQTHLSFVLNGKDYLVDAGRYTYVSGEGRKSFKDQRAHNTVLVDSTECYPEKDSWECLSLSRAVNVRAAFRKEAAAFEGGHLGYIKKGVFVNRRILWLKSNEVLAVIDEFFASGLHDYEALFHFSEDVDVTIDGNRVKAGNGRITVLSAVPLSLSVIPSEISRHYNERTANKALSVKLSATGPVSLWTVFDFSSSESSVSFEDVKSNFKGITFSPETIEAVSVRSDKNDLVIVSAHTEYASPTDTFCAGGCTGFGSLTYFDKKKGCTEIGTRLFS